MVQVKIHVGKAEALAAYHEEAMWKARDVVAMAEQLMQMSGSGCEFVELTVDGAEGDVSGGSEGESEVGTCAETHVKVAGAAASLRANGEADPDWGELVYNPRLVVGAKDYAAGLQVLRKRYGPLIRVADAAMAFAAANVGRKKNRPGERNLKNICGWLYTVAKKDPAWRRANRGWIEYTGEMEGDAESEPVIGSAEVRRESGEVARGEAA